MCREITARDDVHEAEAARIVVDDARARLEMERDVVVRGVLRPVVVKNAWGRSARRRLDAERSAHAEVHDKDIAAVEVREQIFCATTKRDDGSAFKSPVKVRREGKPQVRATALKRLDGRADKC